MRVIPTAPTVPAAGPDPSVYPLTLYFDGACPICSGEMHNLMLRNTAGLLRFVDISEPGFSAFPPGTDMRALMDLMHGQRADGRLAIGAEAIRLAYRGAQLGWLARIMDLPVLRTMCDRAYPVVARNRYRIPRTIVRLVFETGLRRAAQRRAGRSACRDDACEYHPHDHDHAQHHPRAHPHPVRRDGTGDAS